MNFFHINFLCRPSAPGLVLALEQCSELWSRLSFPATGPPDPGRVSEGVSEGSLKGFRRLLPVAGNESLEVMDHMWFMHMHT